VLTSDVSLYAAVWTWDTELERVGTTNGIRIDTLWGDVITALTTTNDTTKQMAGLQLAADNIATAYTNG
jgi:hypothetical protein